MYLCIMYTLFCILYSRDIVDSDAFLIPFIRRIFPFLTFSVYNHQTSTALLYLRDFR